MIGNGLLAFGVFFIVCLFLYLGFRGQSKKKKEQTFKDIYSISITQSFAEDSLNIFINDSLLFAKTMDNSSVKFQINKFSEENMLMVVDCKTDLMTSFNLNPKGSDITIEKRNGNVYIEEKVKE